MSSSEYPLDSVISEALELPPSLRQEYVRKILHAEPTLLSKALVLLRGLENEAPGSFLVNPPVVPDAGSMYDGFMKESTQPLKPGDKFKSFEIVKLLDEGGMGKVYLAVQKTERMKRKVAIKVVHGDLATTEILQRFKYEQRILSELQHANIATLFDADVTEQGTPYLVMEYIDGNHIDAHCDSNSLSIEDRLKLFKTVCNAVQYAQDNLIVHRDLKPSNILITKKGKNVKLLDFGIAKLKDAAKEKFKSQYMGPVKNGSGTNGAVSNGVQPNGSSAHGLAINGQPSGPLNGEAKYTKITDVNAPYTPAYAAPEQFAGAPVNAATDVYSLGVILFKLLTGLLPKKEEEQTSEEDQETTSTHTTNQLKPSRQLTRYNTEEEKEKKEEASRVRGYKKLTHLRREISGDLDAIVVKALELKGKDRYTSAGELGRDIQRYLDRRPIQARTQTLGYRSAKFVRRYHRTAIATLIGFLVLIGGISANIRQSILTQQQTELKELETSRKDATFNFIKNIMNKVDPAKSQGYAFTARELIESGLPEINKLESYPEVYVDVTTMIARVSTESGLYQLADSLIRKAIDTQIDYTNSDDPNLAEPYIRLAEIYERTRKPHEAELFFRQALNLQPDNTTALNNFGAFHLEQGDSDKAIYYFEKAAAVNPTKAIYKINLASTYFDNKQWDLAKKTYTDALELEPHYYAYSNLANIYYYVEHEYTEATRLFKKALDLNDNEYWAWGYYADAQRSENRSVDEFEDSYKEAIRRAQLYLMHVNPGDPGPKADIAAYFMHIGKQDSARDYLNQSLLGKASMGRSATYGVGYVYALLEQHEKAAGYFKEALNQGYSSVYLLNEPSLKNFRNSVFFEQIDIPS